LVSEPIIKYLIENVCFHYNTSLLYTFLDLNTENSPNSNKKYKNPLD